MPWIIGIDEAGYGPNFGPLVMSAVATHVPPDLVEANFWSVLRKVIRKQHHTDDGRLLIDDSKLVYSPAKTILELERSILALWQSHLPTTCSRLSHLLESLAPASLIELQTEVWYEGAEPIPAAAPTADIAAAAEPLADACVRKSIRAFLPRSVIVCPARFNALVDHWGSKGAVLGHGLIELVRWSLQIAADDEPVHIMIDKHGGRNTYGAQLQEALPDGFVVAREEGMNLSAYEVLGLGRELRFAFMPRADASHFTVALASMTSKYLRELLMREFNRFWQAKIDGLKPTAGYPGDSNRFWEEIRPTVQRLGIAERTLWRCR
jgi:ribonuclease HII